MIPRMIQRYLAFDYCELCQFNSSIFSINQEYIHRVGRTARGVDAKGHALLFLTPDERGFLQYLKEAKVPLNEYEFSWSKILNIQPQIEKLISRNYFLNLSAKEAYKAYVRAYDSHSLKNIFDINKLDLQAVSKSFGFENPPFVDLRKCLSLWYFPSH